MRFLALLLCFLLSLGAVAQTLQLDWVETIPGSLNEHSSRISEAPCGDVYVVGFFQGDFGGLTTIDGEDGFVAKYNSQGQLIWLKQLAGTSINRLNGVAVLDDNQIFLVGDFKEKYYYNNDSLVSQDKLDLMLMKIDSAGHIQWAKSAGGMGFQSANDISIAANGNLCVTGYFENDLTIETVTKQGLGLRDVFVATFDQLGNLIWLKSIGGPAFEEGRSIATDMNNNIYVTGSFRDFLYLSNDTLVGNGSYDVYLVKYDANGQLQWIEGMGGPNSDEGTYVNVDNNQDVYVVGWYDRSFNVADTTLSGNKEEDGFVVKFDATGNYQWGMPMAGSFDERAYAVDFDVDNNVYLMGTLDSLLILNGDSLTNRHLNRPRDIYLAKYDQSGNYKWSQAIGYYYNDFCSDLHVKNANTIYITGAFQDSSIFVNDTIISQNGNDVFLAKFFADTTLNVPSIRTPKRTIFAAIHLYPNPTSDQSVLIYELLQDSKVQISIIDLLGRPVRSVLNGHQLHGKYQRTIKKGRLASGLYMLQLVTSEGMEVVPFRLE